MTISTQAENLCDDLKCAFEELELNRDDESYDRLNNLIIQASSLADNVERED